MSVSRGKTKVFRKLKKLQSVYANWKAGTLDLSGKRAKKENVALVTEVIQAGKKAPAGMRAPMKKSMVAKKPVPAMKAKKIGRPPKTETFATTTGFELPNVTDDMVAGGEEQIRKLQSQVKYLRDLIAIRKK